MCVINIGNPNLHLLSSNSLCLYREKLVKQFVFTMKKEIAQKQQKLV